MSAGNATCSCTGCALDGPGRCRTKLRIGCSFTVFKNPKISSFQVGNRLAFFVMRYHIHNHKPSVYFNGRNLLAGISFFCAESEPLVPL